MPVLRPSGSDFTSFVKAAAQYVPAGTAAKASKSGGVSVAKPGLGAVVRTSQVGALASPTTSAVVINGVTPPASGGGAAPGIPINPKIAIAGLVLWLDGSDPAGTGIAPANGATVSTWVDKSASGYNATAVSAGVYSTAQKSITFATTNYYATTYTAAPATETLLIAFMLPSTTATQFMVSGTACGGRIAAGYGNGSPQFLGGANCYSWGASNSVPLVSGTPYFGAIVTNGTSNYMGLNGQLALTGPTNVTYTGGTVTNVGTHSGGLYGTTGYIYEILAYNTVLSAPDRQKAEGYLAWKWGMQSSLPSGHPYFSAAPV